MAAPWCSTGSMRAVRVRRGAGQRARHPGRHRLVAGLRPVTGPEPCRTPVPEPGAAGRGWPDDPATPATPVAADAAQVRDLAASAGTPGRTDAPGSPCAGPAPGWSSGGSRWPGTKRRVASRPSATGPAGPWLGQRPATHPDPGPGAGGARRQPDRPDLHRGSQRRRAVRLVVPVRPGRCSRQHHGGRRPATARCPDGRRRPLRAAGQQADSDRARHLRAMAVRGTRRWSPPGCGSSCAWAVSPGRRCGRCCARRGSRCPGRGPAFGHGAEVALTRRQRRGGGTGPAVIGCYHPSQQNTFTGRVTPACWMKFSSGPVARLASVVAGAGRHLVTLSDHRRRR